MVAKDVVFLEAIGGAILELDAEEIAKVRGWSSTQLDGNSGGIIGYETRVNSNTQ